MESSREIEQRIQKIRRQCRAVGMSANDWKNWLNPRAEAERIQRENPSSYTERATAEYELRRRIAEFARGLLRQPDYASEPRPAAMDHSENGERRRAYAAIWRNPADPLYDTIRASYDSEGNPLPEAIRIWYEARGIHYGDALPVEEPKTVFKLYPKHMASDYVRLALKSEEQWDCCVCLDSKAPCEEMILACGHKLCSDCQGKCANAKCPTCRA